MSHSTTAVTGRSDAPGAAGQGISADVWQQLAGVVRRGERNAMPGPAHDISKR